VPIVHVYGDLGRLPFNAANPHDILFGSEDIIYEHAFNRIKTYTEEDHDEKNLKIIHTLVQNAERIVFLGMGYHERNMTLLFSGLQLRPNCKVWGTARDVDEVRLQAVQSILSTSEGRSRARFEGADCNSLLARFTADIFESTL